MADKRIDPEEQLRILSRISDEILPEGEFVEKERRAQDAGRPLRIKYGMDPTAPDIHLGNAVALHKLAVFQELQPSSVVHSAAVTPTSSLALKSTPKGGQTDTPWAGEVMSSCGKVSSTGSPQALGRIERALTQEVKSDWVG